MVVIGLDRKLWLSMEGEVAFVSGYLILAQAHFQSAVGVCGTDPRNVR